MSASEAGIKPVNLIDSVTKDQCRTDLPDFRPGDTIKVFSRITEGTKERIQAFEGVVIKRHNGTGYSATFTVRKVSYNVGVERTFLLHSPMISKIDLVTRGKVRRARLYYLRPLRGKAARIKTRRWTGEGSKTTANTAEENQ